MHACHYLGQQRYLQVIEASALPAENVCLQNEINGTLNLKHSDISSFLKKK